jgi:DNA-directed RNA polymerase sigma subunit (sigma70/sigma32)
VAATTAELGIGKERVRQVLAKVLKLLSKGNQIEEATQIILKEYEKFN